MKKLNKFFAVLVALAMMATLCVSMAFAETSKEGTPANPDEQLNDAVVTKILQISDNVAAPTATFNFAITPQATSYTITEANPDYDPEDSESQETITRTITGRSANEAAEALKAQTFTINADQNAKGSSKYGTKALSELFKAFPGAGIYTYKITETEPTFTKSTDPKVDDKIRDNINSDEYTVRVYVKADGTKTMTVTDSEGNKVIATAPTGEVDPDNPTGMSFVNAYEKKLVDDPNNPNKFGVFGVEKTVTGDLADTTQQFPFELTLTRAATDTTSGNTVTATIVRAANSKAADTTSVTVTYGSAAKFTLAAGEYLKFDTLPAGTKYQVSEKLTEATATNKGSYQASSGTDTAEKGADLDLAQASLTEAASVTVNNKLDDSDVTPTGILVSNLPYIALALVAIGGLVAYVVVRRRNADEA